MGDMAFVLVFGNLQGLGFSALLDGANRFEEGGVHAVICLLLGMLVTVGAAYLAFRLATIRNFQSAWKRFALIVGMNAAILTPFAAFAALGYAIHGWR